MKTFITLLLLLVSLNGYTQVIEPKCDSTLGEIFLDNCTEIALVPSIQVGQINTSCFTINPTTPGMNLGFIIVNNTCGPIAPYDSLFFELYNATCDTLFQSGEIFPNPYNSWIQGLDTSLTYILCLTWDANCEHLSVCPIITSSPLPEEFLFFKGEYDSKLDCILLTWATASELNSSHFIISESLDLNSFVEVANIPAQGTKPTLTDYMALSCKVYDTDIIYYKLTEIDRDGREVVLNIIPVYINRNADDSIIEIYDTQGKKLSKMQPGINLIKKGRVFYKVFKLD